MRIELKYFFVITALCSYVFTIPTSFAEQDTARQHLKLRKKVTQTCYSEPRIRKTINGVKYVRTPESCFQNVRFPGIKYRPKYVTIDGLKVHYVEAGPKSGETVLMLHGEPSWSYLYRDMIKTLADAGYHAIAMDFIGMGRSDKPIDIGYYSYEGLTNQLEEFITKLSLKNVTLFVQDWGANIGLRLAGLRPDFFERIVTANGFLPVFPEGAMPYPPVENPNELDYDVQPYYRCWPAQQVPFRDEAGNLLIDLDFEKEFVNWMIYTMKSPYFSISEMIEANTWFPLTVEEKAAYDAPFPSRIYMALARYWPSMMLEAEGLNQDAWIGLLNYNKPFLTLYGPNDPGILGDGSTYQPYIDNIPGAAGQNHSAVMNASHFLQDDQGIHVAERIIDFMQSNPLP